MPSNSREKFIANLNKPDYFIELAQSPNLRPIRENNKQLLLHTSLAVIVASWDAYINDLTKEFYAEISSPIDRNFNSIYQIALKDTLTSLRKFNTPNSENVRRILIDQTGFDPIGNWVWTKRGLSGFQVRTWLDEILKVRHSFAHGFSVPSYVWTQSTTGKIRLTSKSIVESKKLITFLVKATDVGMANHILTNYGKVVLW